MSPTRIGSMFLIGLDDAGRAELLADGRQLDVALGLLGGNARRGGVEDRHLHLRSGTLTAREVDQNLAALVIDVSDVAVGPVENQLLLLELIALFADDRRQRLALAGEIFFLLLDLGVSIGDLGGLLVVGGLKLADLGDAGCRRSSSCFFCSARTSAWLFSAALV